MILTFVICAAVIILDRISKYAVLQTLSYGESVPAVPYIFQFTYIKNRGAAFGMLADNRWIFLLISTVAIIAVVIYIVKTKPQNIWERLSLGMIIGGGIGNMIDRVFSGYVVDFIDLLFVDFAIFNVADCFVTVGCGILILYLIFSYKKDKTKKSTVSEKNE